MNERQDQGSMESSALNSVERLLERFGPVGPPAALRERTLASALAAARGHRRRLAVGLWRAAVAAGIVAAVALNLSALRVSQRIDAQIGVGQDVWTAQVAQAADLLNGEGLSRQYLAMVLRAGARPISPIVPQIPWDENNRSSSQ
jgi:hypothetical protein